MTNKLGPIAQLFLRIALGVGFLWPVMDRLGWLGSPESGKVAWGNWAKFIGYTNSLLPFLNKDLANIAGIIATVAEVTFGICLIIGCKTRLMAAGAAILTFSFAICMAIFVSPRAPFNYPVFVFTGAGMLLASIPNYNWSIDRLFYKE